MKENLTIVLTIAFLVISAIILLYILYKTPFKERVVIRGKEMTLKQITVATTVGLISLSAVAGYYSAYFALGIARIVYGG